jgi:AcrR family transcriptional regulator
MNIHSERIMAEILGKSKPKAGDDKRDRLLTAALELFVARGFDGVSVPEIAAKARVAVGTVYRYFETKEALVNALYRRWKTLYNEIVLAPMPAGQSTRRQFGTYWQRMTLFARARPEATRFMDLHHHGDYLDEESRALSRKYREVAEAFIADGRKSGQLRPLDPIMVVALMWGAAAGLVKFASQGALEFDARTATDMEDALWRAIAKD